MISVDFSSDGRKVTDVMKRISGAPNGIQGYSTARHAAGRSSASREAISNEGLLGEGRGQQADTKGEQPDLVGNSPFVTVVIPCYNQAHFLGEAIESVLSQSYKHLELIVVDDGSSDNTSEVASSYEEVHLVRQENRGLSAARNAGITHSEGEYLVFLDADDRLLPRALELGLECFDAHPECAFVCGHHKYIAVDGTVIQQHRPPRVDRDYYKELLRRNFVAMHATVMYRSTVFKTVGGFNSALNACEDYDIYLRIASRFPIYYHAKLVAEYRIHDENMSRDPRQMLSSAIEVHRSQWKNAKKTELYKRAYRAGVKHWQGAYGGALVERARARIHKGDWSGAVSDIYSLFRYYPQGLALLLPSQLRDALSRSSKEGALNEERQERHRLQDVLEKERQDRRRLQEILEKERQERRRLKRALDSKRKQISRVQERNQLLISSQQDLERRLQEIESSRAWTLLQRIGGARSAIVGKEFKGQPSSEPPRPPTESPALQEPSDSPNRQVQRTSARQSGDRRPPVGNVDFGHLRRVTPISDKFGFDRGQPIDRYYIETFLAQHAEDIQGRVLEIGDATYTQRFGGERVTVSDVLHVSEGNPQATIVADLADAVQIPSDTFNCIIFTQTLQFIYDVRPTIRTLYRILKPGGILLATVPGIGRMLDSSQDKWGVSYHWAFTLPSVRRLFAESFRTANVELEAHGNVLAAICFLHGLAAEELRREELDHREAAYDGYEVLITLRAVKPQTNS